MNNANNPRPLKRWFQFTLRTLLLLTMVVAAYFAGFGTARKIDEKVTEKVRDQAAAELESARQSAMLAEKQAAEASALKDEAMFWSAFQSTAKARSDSPSSK